MAEPHLGAIATLRQKASVCSVIELDPEVAVFDCDGTLWSGDGGKDFLYWVLRPATS